jgi:hypothetical protein
MLNFDEYAPRRNRAMAVIAHEIPNSPFFPTCVVLKHKYLGFRFRFRFRFGSGLVQI